MIATLFVLIPLLVLSVLTGSAVSGQSQEIDISGESVAPEQFQVKFTNNYEDKTVSFWWDGSQFKQGSTKMGDIPPLGTVDVNTIAGHVFYVSELDDEQKRLVPSQVTIKESKTDYSFGPRVKTNMAAKKTVTKNPHVKLLNSPTKAMSVKFRCHAPAVDIYYENGRGGSIQGALTMGKESTINTYEGHTFFFTEKNNKDKELARFVMEKDKVVRVIEDPDHPAPAHIVQHTQREQEFLDKYYNSTGTRWRHYYGPNGPRPPPTLYMWPAKEIGEVHTVESTEGFWHCKGTRKDCQSAESITFELEVVSLAPKVFIIPNFISDFEAQTIIDVAKDKVKESSVGNDDGGGARKSDTRTSRNAWVGRKTNDIIETLYLRAADLLNIDEALLNNKRNAEDMQVVNYHEGQEYQSHHDWGVSGYAESRFITLLMYLTDMEDPDAGGETAFPKAADGQGIKVHPGKRSAVLFYNLLEDGNGDDLALHAALPVKRGVKWLANFWVWDPKRK